MPPTNLRPEHTNSERLAPCPDCLIRGEHDHPDYPSVGDLQLVPLLPTESGPPRKNPSQKRGSRIRSCETCNGIGFGYENREGRFMALQRCGKCAKRGRVSKTCSSCSGRGVVVRNRPDPYDESPRGFWHEKRRARADGRVPRPASNTYWVEKTREWRVFRPIELVEERDPNRSIQNIMREPPIGKFTHVDSRYGLIVQNPYLEHEDASPWNHGRCKSTDWNPIDLEAESAAPSMASGWTRHGSWKRAYSPLEATDNTGASVVPILNSDGEEVCTVVPSHKKYIPPSRRKTGNPPGRPQEHENNAEKQRAYRKRLALRNSEQVSEERDPVTLQELDLSASERETLKLSLSSHIADATSLLDRLSKDDVKHDENVISIEQARLQREAQ